MHESFNNGGEYGTGSPRHKANEEFAESLHINGQEILVTENCLSVCVYDTAYARYDHLRINSASEHPILYFPPERMEMMKWIGRMSPILSQKPEDYIREEYWERIPIEDVVEDEDIVEREMVMAAKAGHLLAESEDIETSFASLLS